MSYSDARILMTQYKCTGEIPPGLAVRKGIRLHRGCRSVPDDI